jgi:HPt (histidine-containing phosphotransfer) domain-containing protein
MADDLDSAIAAIWAERRPEMMRRVDVIEAAVAALDRGALGDDQRAEAEAAAHRIAGAAGSFGFPDATRLAREIELALRSGAKPADAARLGELATAIRAEFS